MIIAHLKLCLCDAVVCVGDHHLAAQVVHCFKFRREKQTRRAEKLELTRTDSIKNRVNFHIFEQENEKNIFSKNPKSKRCVKGKKSSFYVKL